MIGIISWDLLCTFFFFAPRLSSYGLSNLLTYNDKRGRPSYDKIIGYIKKAKDGGDEILIGGSGMTFFFFFWQIFFIKHFVHTDRFLASINCRRRLERILYPTYCDPH